jgi:hypothetical protein
LENASSQFEQALKEEPTHQRARFANAVCMAGAIAMRAEGVGEAPPPPPFTPPGAAGGVSGVELPPLPPNSNAPRVSVVPYRHFGLFWNLQISAGNPVLLMRILSSVTHFQSGLLPFYGYQQDRAARRQQWLEQLQRISDELTLIEADPNFSDTIPNPLPGPERLKVGLPEIYLFHAYVHALRTELALSLAYVREIDPKERDFRRPAERDKNSDGKLTPDEYLPADPFLTLRDARLLTTARDALRAVVEKANKGIAGVLARPANDTSFLLPNTPELNRALTTARDTTLPLLSQATSGPVTVVIPAPSPMPLLGVPGNTLPRRMPVGNRLFDLVTIFFERPPDPPADMSITFHLAAWFQSPPADLKRLAPTYTLLPNGWPDLSRTTFPDATFAGLFPNGLPRAFWF